MAHNDHKLKGFTLSEMMVVLVITLIVVGLAFSVLRLVRRQMAGIGTNYENNTELNLLRQALWIDFHTYPYGFYDNGTQTLRFENEIKTLHYTFERERIIREKDTFAIELQGKAFYFDGQEVSLGPIDALELQSLKKQGNKTLFVYQENAADEYLY